MGREIRRVPPNWSHPKQTCRHIPPCSGYECFIPMYEESFASAATEWKKQYAEFYSSGKDKKEKCEFWEWDSNPPKRERHVEYSPEEATWYQVYETVSEGTPVTPPFADPLDLVKYLSTHGDFWDQKGGKGPWDEKSAKNFVLEGGYRPSMWIDANGLHTSKEQL